MEARKALDDIRVLDLSNPLGVYCGKLLADLGADVIKVEPPGGDKMRQIGPFYHDEPHPEKSLYWFYFNTNKKSITLNLESAKGQSIFKDLVRKSDVVLTTFAPSSCVERGVGYEALRAVNKRVIVVSVTPFGLTGPYADFKGSNIIGMAMGGFLNLFGFPDSPPVCIAGEQAYNLASANAAVGALIALYWRDVNGEGQQVDVSMEDAVLKIVFLAVSSYKASGKILKRSGLELYRGIKDTFACKDGYVLCAPLGGGGADVMLDWMEKEGKAADLRDDKYADVIAAIGSRRLQKDRRFSVDPHVLTERGVENAHVHEVWETWLKTHTKEELFKGAQERGVGLMPVYDAADIAEEPQLSQRSFFVDVAHPEMGKLRCPGAPYRLSRTPWAIHRRPPIIGEHNTDIYEKELGMTAGQIGALRKEGVI